MHTQQQSSSSRKAPSMQLRRPSSPMPSMLLLFAAALFGHAFGAEAKPASLPSSAALVDQQGDEERIMMPMPLSDSDDEMLLMLGQRPSPQQSYWIQRHPSAPMVDRTAKAKRSSLGPRPLRFGRH